MKSFVRGMDTIGHNIANVNTMGFKAQRTNYSDNFSETLQSALPQTGDRSNTPPMQIGTGVGLGSVQKLFTQGTVNQTGVDSDLAIAGSGFFTVYDASNNTNFVTRTGNFRVNQEGYMVDQNGYYLLGLTGGSQFENPDSIGRIRIDLANDVRVDAQNRPVDMQGNIILEDANRASPNASSSTGFYYTDPAGRPLDPNGRIILSDGTFAVANPNSPTGYDHVDDSQTPPEVGSWNPNAPMPTIGMLDQAMEWDPANPQIAVPAASADDPRQQPLAIESWAIDKEGQVNLFLNDGSTYTRGQLLLQQVNDPSSLSAMGNGLYSGTVNAGPVGGMNWAIGTRPTEAQLQYYRPNENGVGFIQARALEGSNVDLTEEFSNMITTQRAFQAGSRLISTSDDMLQEIVNLKR